MDLPSPTIRSDEINPNQTITANSSHPFGKFPEPIKNITLHVERLPLHPSGIFDEIKDPSIVLTSEGRYEMFCSIGSSLSQSWRVGRFIATDPLGTWVEQEPVIFDDLKGPQLCAPAVTFNHSTGEYHMFVQTGCFEENTVIAHTRSNDGKIFSTVDAKVLAKESIESPVHPIVGVYDISVSEIKVGDQLAKCAVYSCYRRIGCGDIYMSLGIASDEGTMIWSKGSLIVSQDAPEWQVYHNHPGSPDFEWGLEGAKIVQFGDSFLLIAVCFLPEGIPGTRQRVIMATASSPYGPFTPWYTPFVPSLGEVGHPDTLIDGSKLYVHYQRRDGEHQPWYLCAAEFDADQFSRQVTGVARSSSTYQTAVAP